LNTFKHHVTSIPYKLFVQKFIGNAMKH
jgi:hypothetical protein